MRVYGPSGTRASPFDRAPLRVNDGNFSDVAGGGIFTLVEYTVPANRRAQVLSEFVFAVVTTALAAAQTHDARVELEAPGPGILEVMMMHLRAASPLGQTVQAVGSQRFLVAGDLYRIRFSSAAGAGVVRVTGGYSIIEYDA